MPSIDAGFKAGYNAEGPWKPLWAEAEDPIDDFEEVGLPAWRAEEPRNLLCKALNGHRLPPVDGLIAGAALGEGGAAEGANLQREEGTDWHEVGRQLGRGAKRAMRCIEFSPLLSLCWAALVAGSLRVNKAVLPSTAAIFGMTIWCSDENELTNKLPDDLRYICQNLEEAIGMVRKHTNKGVAPLAVSAVLIWALGDSFTIPFSGASVVFGAVLGHKLGTRNEWTPPEPAEVSEPKPELAD